MLDKRYTARNISDFFFQNYELLLKYEIENVFISSIFTGHDLEQNTF